MDTYFFNAVKTGNLMRMDTFYYFFYSKVSAHICIKQDTKTNNNNMDGLLKKSNLRGAVIPSTMQVHGCGL